ncbi:uncharacterized protein TM35_000161490 [Trypanosoma theileri]|uniref:Uncharacterized protein n=1 Tax=Trypanosoma theileri TaxID=67003 RepID=A0A1X0NV72_9TRYP|nr:uncharacterized protein TM35_000161490 [Trypanosoma theileri]ORC88511.1 hypothetical protein TM35_000161490 [Trypanosoma theileri]
MGKRVSPRRAAFNGASGRVLPLGGYPFLIPAFAPHPNARISKKTRGNPAEREEKKARSVPGTRRSPGGRDRIPRELLLGFLSRLLFVGAPCLSLVLWGRSERKKKREKSEGVVSPRRFVFPEGS